MLRGAFLLGVFAVSTIEPSIPMVSDEHAALISRVLDKGGLAVVVLVIVWMYRRDFLRLFKGEQAKTAMLWKQNEVLIGLVRDSNIAITTSTGAALGQKEAIHRLAKAVELLERRSGSDRRSED